MEGSDNTQPIISSEIVVKVKLLTNEVYEITADPEISVAELKRLISVKTNVPVDRQRLVFGGKQLVDNQPLSAYIKESGLTIHLIARQQQPQENQSNPNPTPPQPQQQPQQPVPPQMMRPPQGLPPPFSIFSMMGPPQPGSNQQQPNPNVFAQNINSAVNNLMGNLGIRLVPGPLQPPQPQNISPPPAQQQQPNQPPQQQQSSSFNPNVGNQRLEQLEQSISRVNLPPYSLPNNSNPREYTIQYLRRLQNNMLRFIPQLNRGIQLLQEGRTTHLPEFINIFESLNNSNNGAIEAIRALTSPQQQQQHNHNCNDPTHQHNHQQQQQNQPQQQGNNEMQNQGINATIIIAQNDDGTGNGAINVEVSNQQGQNIINAMSGFLQQGSGFNFANLFAPRNDQPQPQQQQQPQSQQQQPQSQPQQLESNPIPQSNQNISPQSSNASQPEQVIPPPANNNSLSPPSQNPQPAQQNPQNPLGGINIMSVFNNLQQSGGMGTLLGMSLGAMLEEENQPTTVYSAILAPVTGGEILACFTQKDFSFIGRKRAAFREATLRAVAVAGSREELVNKYAKDIELMLIPEGSVRNEEVCRKRVAKILHKHIEKIVCSFLEAAPELDLTEAVLSESKALFNESIEEISKHTEGVESVFANIKRGFIQSFDQLIPGFSGLLYGFIERDMVRVYRQFAEEKRRRQEMSEEEAKDEAELLKKIELQAAEDSQAMAAFEHSEFYPQHK